MKKARKAAKLRLNKTAAQTVRIMLALLLCAALIIAAPHLSAEPVTAFINYFKTYPSASTFSRANQTLSLRKGVFIASYDMRSDVFITRQNLFDEYKEHLGDIGGLEETSGEIYLFGFASAAEELVPPSYSHIVAIQGDYAIVARPTFPSGANTSFDDIVYKVGVVKFRGANAGDRTDFSTDFNGTEMTPLRFVGDYICVLNDKDDMRLNATEVTFYDYKSSHKLLEAFKVRADISYNYSVFDDNLVAYTSSKAEFYKIGIVDSKGFLAITDTYRPFPEDTDGTLEDFMTVMVSYLGNDWFMRQGYIEVKQEELDPSDLAGIAGKLIKIDKFDDQLGSMQPYYMLMRSDRYNSASKVMLSNGLLIPDMVANKYNESSTRDIADYLNNTIEKGADDKFAYYPPSMPVGALPKDGMSIVYYYFFPYANDAERYAISYLMMDSNANMFHPKSNIMMPLLMIDGAGVQIDDPDYEINRGHVQLIDSNNNVNIFKEYDYGEYEYKNIAYNNGILIAAEYNPRKQNEMLYGAFNSDGRQITHFKYLELSLFYGEYAIGMNKVNDDFRYYRIDKSGNETVLYDVLAIRNGVYITVSGGKVGLKAYDGSVLLPNEYDKIDVLETFLTDGAFQKSVVTAEKENRGYVFVLEN